jgi:hypothetical protein
MVIGFKERFVKPILKGEKIHTIRFDENDRWKEGNVMHMATGVRTSKYNCFRETICEGTQVIEFKWKHKFVGREIESSSVQVFIDGKDFTNNNKVIDTLIKNDGFKSKDEFFAWESWNGIDFKGKIIHWTNFRYK